MYAPLKLLKSKIHMNIFAKQALLSKVTAPIPKRVAEISMVPIALLDS